MPTEGLVIIGAGGHSKVVVDALLCGGATLAELCVVDDDEQCWQQTILGAPVHGGIATKLRVGAGFHVAIGRNAARERIARLCIEAGMTPRTVFHPRAHRADSAALGAGAFIAAGAIVGPSASIGEYGIVNHAAVIDHDCVVGAFSHIAPNATLGGAVRIGLRVLIGAGATVLPGVSIGDDCVVGAGAVVLQDVLAGGTVVGTPARRVGGDGR